MQITTTMRYHPTQCRKTIIKKKQQIASVGEDVENRKAPCIVGGVATTENSMQIPQNIKTSTTTCFRNSSLGIYLKKAKTLIRKDMCTLISIALLCTIDKMWNYP